MSNSPLVQVVVLSPNHSGKRIYPITRITPHCVVGRWSAQQTCESFKPASRNASCNYAIGWNGEVGLCVDECNRSWCSSSAANDQRAVTIECASDRTHPYAMSDDVYKTLVALCTDICRRNGLNKLLWLGSKEATLSYKVKPGEAVLTAHRWFAAKACPGDWLYSRFGDLAIKVSQNLSGDCLQPTPEPPAVKVTYKVQTGAFSHYNNAVAMRDKLRESGLDAFVVHAGRMYKVQLGSFVKKDNAYRLSKRLRSMGIDCFVVSCAKPAKEKATAVHLGSKVKVRRGAHAYTGGSVAAFVYNGTYTVDELTNDRAVLDKKGICTAFNVADLILC